MKKYNTNIIQLWYSLCSINYVCIVCIFFCIFVSSESFGINPKHFTYDKSLPKGNNTERLVSQFLELSDNPKGKLAYKPFLTMSEKKNFVAVSTYANVTSTQKNSVINLASDLDFYNRYLNLLPTSTSLHDAFLKVSIEYFKMFNAFKYKSYSNFKNLIYGKF